MGCGITICIWTVFLSSLLYSNKGILTSPYSQQVVWQRVGIGRSTRLWHELKGSMKLNSMLGLIRKPGRTIGFPFLSVFKRLVPRDRRIIAISALAKQTLKRESSSFARMGITAALTLLQVWSAMKKRNGYLFLLSWPEVSSSAKPEERNVRV